MIQGNAAETDHPTVDERAGTDVAVVLWVEVPSPNSTPQPVTVGLPFPRGCLRDPRTLGLADPEGRDVDLRAEPLAWWPGGSVKWLLLDFVVGPSREGRGRWSLGTRARPAEPGRSSPLHVRQVGGEIQVETGVASLRLDRQGLPIPSRLGCGRREIPVKGSARLRLEDRDGREIAPRFGRVAIESEGPVRATIRSEGTFGGRSPCRFVVRTCAFAGTGLVRLRVTLHNPRRARHAGGHWDLGDSGSVLFRSLALELSLDWPELPQVVWSAEAGQGPRTTAPGPLEIYQDSSGGQNWQSRNHVNRDGRQPCSFRGYRLTEGEAESYGLRASPVVSLRGADVTLAAAVPDFWQQFPKAIGADGRRLKVGLFPGQFGDLFELQGGEQKTHTIWLDFGVAGDRPGLPLDWAHRPALVRATPGWYARSGVIPHLSPAAAGPKSPIDSLLSAPLGGPRDLFARREVVDEYGWRNYGEVHADHESEHYRGPAPVISHYNNQYDLINGALTQFLRSGESRWYEFADALARHVIDIDIYHTDRDKAAFNGGLFWHTDHYRDAATCTHRAYSGKNAGGLGRRYGGGPGACHNYATGLLHYHYLTGDPQARDAVVGLADWVLHMDEGAESVLGILDPSPTGLANDPGEVNYQGPCRGAGNSVNVLMDGWLLTGRRAYLGKAEELIRRVAHPEDDVATRDLLEVERRWSYTVFLSALARYLHIKAEASDLDLMYLYAQATLVRYGRWMLDHERPYFDQLERIEFPTETWACQEFRKANVLRLAAAHDAGPASSAMHRRGNELADRALSDLLRFPRWDSTRAIALLLAEGPRSATLSRGPALPAPRSTLHPDFDPPEAFVPQKERVFAGLRTPLGLLRALFVLADPRNWRKLRLAGHP